MEGGVVRSNGAPHCELKKRRYYDIPFSNISELTYDAMECSKGILLSEDTGAHTALDPIAAPLLTLVWLIRRRRRRGTATRA